MATTIALCSPELKPGDVKFNTEKIIDCLAKTKNADIVVFPRLCITGATCGDMYAFPTLSDAAFNALQTIAAACPPHETVIWDCRCKNRRGLRRHGNSTSRQNMRLLYAERNNRRIVELH